MSSKDFSVVVSISGEVEEVTTESGIESGLAAVTFIGSMASITIIDYEPALVKDMKRLLEKIVSKEIHSRYSAKLF